MQSTEPSNMSSSETMQKFILQNIIIVHPLIPMEYPLTSMDGVAVIYYVEGWGNKEAAFADKKREDKKLTKQLETTLKRQGVDSNDKQKVLDQEVSKEKEEDFIIETAKRYNIN
ncbi:hypothetical protein C1646_817227 [Rhizophagus diaphanus]|nr:hypothetical protein C1646_817227 [Rhizophagus diaphanus] [Rhizophagus sp. MUCL 43196]